MPSMSRADARVQRKQMGETESGRGTRALVTYLASLYDSTLRKGVVAVKAAEVLLCAPTSLNQRQRILQALSVARS